MRRLLPLAVVALLVATLVALGWMRWPREEGPHATSALPTVEVPQVTTTAATATSTPAPAPSTTTSAPVPHIMLASASAGETVPAAWRDPLLAVSAGETWVALGESGADSASFIGRLAAGEWTRYEVTGGIVMGLALAPDGVVWAATGAGVFSFDGANWERRFDAPAGGVAVDRDGTVWVGGRSESGYRSTQRLWLARGDGLSWERVDPFPDAEPGYYGDVSLAVLPGGDIWMVHRAGYWVEDRPVHFDGTTMEEIDVPGIPDATPEDGLPAAWFMDIAAAPDGLWVVGYLAADPDRAVLARLEGVEWVVYDWPYAEPAGSALHTMNLAVGPDGVVWFAFEGGLRSFDGTNWTLHLKGKTIHNVAVAPDGTVWFSDAEGVHILDAP